MPNWSFTGKNIQIHTHRTVEFNAPISKAELYKLQQWQLENCNWQQIALDQVGTPGALQGKMGIFFGRFRSLIFIST